MCVCATGWRQEAGLLWEQSQSLKGPAPGNFLSLPSLAAVTPFSVDVALAHAANLASTGHTRAACDAFIAVVPLLSPRAFRSGGLSSGRLVAAQCLLGRASAASSCPWLASTVSLSAVPVVMPDVMHVVAMCASHDAQDIRLVRDCARGRCDHGLRSAARFSSPPFPPPPEFPTPCLMPGAVVYVSS